MRVPFTALSVLLLVGSAAHAYRRIVYQGKPLYRPGYANVLFSIVPSLKGGITNADGKVVITPDSDPAAALQAALNTWNGVQTSKARFEPLWVGQRNVRAGDGLNVFSFADTPELRSLVGSAIAVTNTAYTFSGSIVDSDIIFNPTMAFSSTVILDTFDIQAIATHELGHALGADHSPLESATMYAYSSPEDTAPRRLSSDDIAFVTDVYPANGAYVGAIDVSLSSGGSPVGDAQVIAVSAPDGVVVGGDSASTAGSYHIGGLPPGNYLVFADNATAGLPGSTGWLPGFYGGNAAPTTVAVSGGAKIQAGFTVEKGPGQVTFDFVSFGVAAQGGGFVWNVLPSGLPMELSVTGRGFSDTMRPEDILLLGPGLALRPESIQVYPFGDADKTVSVSAVFDVAPRQDWTSAVIAMRTNGAVTFRSGLRIRPAGPWLTPSGTVNAASYLSGGVAPGEIVTLFGTGLGPLQSASAEGLDPATGRLAPNLGGVSVTFDGVPAPLFYVSSGQVNLQAPYEIAGRSTATVEVSFEGLSDRVLMPVAPASPAIFYGAVVNQDGTLNSYSDPIAREDIIVTYGTGQGIVEPGLATGEPAQLDPLSFAANVTATVDGKPADVLFAGMAPGFVGLLQANIKIPAAAAPGDLVPLEISINGISSPTMYVAVK